jgi:hypothetical protein
VPGISETTVTILEVGTNSLLPLGVARVVGVIHGESLQYSKLSFDQVEPTGLGGRPDRMNVQFLEQRQELGVIVNLVEIVENYEQAATRIAFAESAEGIHDLGQSTPRLKHSVQVIAMDIVESQKVLDAVGPMVGGTAADRATLPRPGNTTHGPDLQGPPLVEAQHHGSRRAVLVEPFD